LFVLILAALSLAMLGLLIWTNQYGRELSSSPPGFGVLPALVALLALIVYKRKDLARVWETDKAVLALLGLLLLVLLGFLWIAERSTFYVVIVSTAILALAWWIGTHSGLALLTTLSLAIAGTIILANGGDFLLIGPEYPMWLLTAIRIAAGFGMILAIFLAGAVAYSALRADGAGLDWRGLGGRAALLILLVGACAYYVYWEGIWSSAHARAFEDHLPFSQFLISLMVGILLALTLRGWRRWAGPAFIAFVTTATTLALILGWGVSAFEVTGRRAARIDQALAEFNQENGRYPSNLGELTPDYLLYLAPPVVVDGGGWCYQGGEYDYRLGYVSGSFTYSNAHYFIETFADSGVTPQGGWICDELLARMKATESDQ
jgi:hypothetical protein